MAPTRSIFMDISSRVSVVNTSDSADLNSEEGMLSMAFDPGYLTNRYFYVFYMGQATNGTSGLHDILSRFQILSGNTNQGDTTSETKFILQYDRASNHNAGDLHFGGTGIFIFHWAMKVMNITPSTTRSTSMGTFFPGFSE